VQASEYSGKSKAAATPFHGGPAAQPASLASDAGVQKGAHATPLGAPYSILSIGFMRAYGMIGPGLVEIQQRQMRRLKPQPQREMSAAVECEGFTLTAIKLSERIPYHMWYSGKSYSTPTPPGGNF
jgi:hypothetical protein